MYIEKNAVSIWFLVLITAFFYLTANADALTGSEACDNPNLRPADRVVLNCDKREAALEYLKSLRKGEGSCKTTSDPSFEMLNPTFTVCAAQFLKAFESQYNTKITITSAGRTDSQQKCVCPIAVSGKCGAVGSSNHQRGFALDVHPANGDYMTMQAFARANPKFGVCFPLGTRDRPHLIQSGIGGSESNNCKAQGIEQKCDGSPPLVITTPPPSGSAPPSNALAQSLRNWLAPQPPQQPQQAVTATPSQPASASQNALSAFQEPQTIGGVSGQLTMAPAATTTNSIADRLEVLAFPTTTQTGGSATTVPLVVTGDQAVQLAAGVQSTTTPGYGSSGIISPSQSTFISGDLSWQGVPQPPQQLTGFQATLANVRAILERILALLTPFNARYVISGDSHEHETLE